MKYASLSVLVLIGLVTGCATTPQTTFYLVPDPDGHVGEVTVKNEAASVTLNKANETVAAESADTAFSASRVATADEIQAKFGEALALVPPAPKGFDIYFDSDSSNVNVASVPVVDQVLAEMRARGSRDISLNGHTDRTGDDAYNMRLSLERANTVRKLLLERGVPAEDMTIEYYGESKPVVPTADNVSEPKNRRVEVVVR